MTPEELDNLLRPIPDWPKPGVTFRDIGPLLDDPKALMAAVAAMVAPWRETPIDVVAGPNPVASSSVPRSRGPWGWFRAQAASCPLRSAKSRTPSSTAKTSWKPRPMRSPRRVLLVDDVLATEPLSAAAALVEQQQGVVVGAGILLEIPFWKAGSCLPPCGWRPQLKRRQRKRGPQGHHHHNPTHSTTPTARANHPIQAVVPEFKQHQSRV